MAVPLSPPPRGDARPLSATPAPPVATPARTQRTSSGPPPPPQRRVEAAPSSANPDRRAEYVPAPPRADEPVQATRSEEPAKAARVEEPAKATRPEELPKIPRLEPLAGIEVPKTGNAPPATRADAHAPQRSSSVPPPPPNSRDLTTAPPAAPSRSASPASTPPGGFERFAVNVRDSLPSPVRTRVQELPAVPLFLVGASLSLLLLVGLALGVRAGYRSLAAEDTTAARAAVPSSDEATAADTPAESKPAAAVQTGESKAPAAPQDEAAVLLELADSLIAQRRDGDVPSLVARLIARQPEKKDDPRVAKILLHTAASDDRQAAGESHNLLTGAMGEVGAALLYELSIKSGVRDGVRARAESWLKSKDFERTAPLNVYAAVKIKNAKTCEDKHALLDFAERAGGKYVLDVLREIDKRKACAPDDLVHCYPCMRNDSRLSDVIQKLEQRK